MNDDKGSCTAADFGGRHSLWQGLVRVERLAKAWGMFPGEIERVCDERFGGAQEH